MDGAGEETVGDSNAALLADIVKHERDMRDRNSAMSVPNKRFTRGLELGAAALRQLDPSRPQQQQRQSHAPSTQHARQVRRSNRLKTIQPNLQVVKLLLSTTLMYTH